MKHIKKLASLLLALTLVFALATTAFADGSNSITVNGAKKDETYKIYKMLDLIVDIDKGAYSYTLNSDWADFFTTGDGKNYVNIDVPGNYVTWKADKNNPADMEAFGKAAAAAASKMTADKTQTPTGDGSVTFTGLDAGYYLITSTYGTLAIVDTTPTNPDAIINEKNSNPVPEKKVQEDSTSAWGDENSAQIGDTVNFKTTLTVKKGARNYVLHDKMDDGLSFNANSVVIANLTKDTDYTVVTTGLTDDCTFEIRFKQSYLDTITGDTALTITYNAVLNEKADITSGEKNDAKITWGNASSSEWDETVTKTYQFKVLKYAKTDTEKNPLAGATFQLKDASGTVVKLVQVTTITDTTTDVEYRIANGNEQGAVESFTTVASGKIVIKGVDLDKYTLVETAAPAGYNSLKGPVEVTVQATNALTVEVPNASGTTLPSTGGMGTTLFYVLGGILAVTAVVLLVTKKRMNSAE